MALHPGVDLADLLCVDCGWFEIPDMVKTISAGSYCCLIKQFSSPAQADDFATREI